MMPAPPPTPLALRAGRPLESFLARIKPLTLVERRTLVEQALIVLEGFYVHLLLKRAMHAVDPIQRLRLLRYRLDAMPDGEFHSELIGIFTSLRDLHTLYQLPEPSRGSVAALGFLIERYYPSARSKPRFVISKLHPQLRSRSFQPGVELVSWNGVPIVRAIERNAERASGSNPDARVARGLEVLAFRPLRTMLPPDEPFVLVGYRTPRGASREVRIAWRVLSAASARRGHDAVGTIHSHHGIDSSAESVRHIKAALATAAAVRPAPQSLLRADTLPAARGPVGYLRIYSFNAASARAFLDQAAQLVQQLPKRGLIVDIRANPGGSIPAAEGLLQLLTTQTVEPSSFSLTPTAATSALCAANPALSAWAASIDASVETGEVFSQAFPLSNPRALIESHQPYAGRLVLITDALSYSAADIFAAGFQDNNLGPVLGTDPHTGAGGANVWTHDLLRLWLPDDLQPLPAGASFRIALRRATRANTRIGIPIEDLGVQPDHIRRPTYRDITEHNQDLLAAAIRLIDRPHG